MALDDHVKNLAKELELGSLASEKLGTYVLPLDEGISIFMTNVSEGISLTCNFAPCPKTNKEAFYTQMLLANLFGQGTHDAILGMQADGNLLTLSKILDYNTDYKQFKEAVEDFMNVVDFWRAEALNHK